MPLCSNNLQRRRIEVLPWLNPVAIFNWVGNILYNTWAIDYWFVVPKLKIGTKLCNPRYVIPVAMGDNYRLNSKLVLRNVLDNFTRTACSPPQLHCFARRGALPTHSYLGIWE